MTQESSGADAENLPRDHDIVLRMGLSSAAMDDTMVQQIEAFRCSRGALLAERRNRSYTIYHANSGALVARPCPTASTDRFEILYWSLWNRAMGVYRSPRTHNHVT